MSPTTSSKPQNRREPHPQPYSRHSLSHSSLVRILLTCFSTGLKNEEANNALFTRLIAGIRAEHPDTQSVEEAQKADNWLILLMHDTMDVRLRNQNDEIDYENSDGMLIYA